MESSSNKIILIQYKIQMFNFYFSEVFKAILNQNITPSHNKIVKYYISSVTESNLIIEVILKDS